MCVCVCVSSFRERATAQPTTGRESKACEPLSARTPTDTAECIYIYGLVDVGRAPVSNTQNIQKNTNDRITFLYNTRIKQKRLEPIKNHGLGRGVAATRPRQSLLIGRKILLVVGSANENMTSVITIGKQKEQTKNRPKRTHLMYVLRTRYIHYKINVLCYHSDSMVRCVACMAEFSG